MRKLNPSPKVVLTRRTVIAGVASFVAVVLVGILGWYTVNTTAHTADTKAGRAFARAVEVQNVIIARNTAENRANAVVAHAQCLRGNDGRVLIRESEVDIVAIIFGANTNRSPEQQAVVSALQQRINDRAAELLKEIDCDSFAPMPPNPTKAELDSLPKPTPVPPLD